MAALGLLPSHTHSSPRNWVRSWRNMLGDLSLRADERRGVRDVRDVGDVRDVRPSGHDVHHMQALPHPIAHFLELDGASGSPVPPSLGVM